MMIMVIMKDIQDRTIILQNSIKILELIMRNLVNQKKSLYLDKIQKRINSYNQELQIYNNLRINIKKE